jgi:four helix bundle protein
MMNSEELKKRTKIFALEVIKLVEKLPKSPAGKVIGYQLVDCATSVGANYRSACRARSKADFVSKITIVEEEADESCYWLELLKESDLIDYSDFDKILKEADELTAIFTSSGKTSRIDLQTEKQYLKSKTSIPNPKSLISNPKS